MLPPITPPPQKLKFLPCRDSKWYKITLTYLLTYSMEQSPFEKLTGSQPVKKFPAFYGTRMSITEFTSAYHWYKIIKYWKGSIQQCGTQIYQYLLWSLLILTNNGTTTIEVTNCHTKLQHTLWNGLLVSFSKHLQCLILKSLNITATNTTTQKDKELQIFLLCNMCETPQWYAVRRELYSTPLTIWRLTATLVVVPHR
jgi:hypothetical protein